ncbi:hypothetical protein H634G_10646 [Metarhizium anisopliae BRIP 53293]|uniref:Uncharacterized protein n=1 Tax=Metarhizium anisopliae BRIP 53293 TaxID=1291518 RepID=A0A0D9NJ89_METAN|nr:hypothetical protein H634G_10646 [Metarhizium anisopliae BRIP 53293]KJK87038.1 hypothetical protein H633G_09109 [Metarhizium anisopliae BRIP 53284]
MMYAIYCILAFLSLAGTGYICYLIPGPTGLALQLMNPVLEYEPDDLETTADNSRGLLALADDAASGAEISDDEWFDDFQKLLD